MFSWCHPLPIMPDLDRVAICDADHAAGEVGSGDKRYEQSHKKKKVGEDDSVRMESSGLGRNITLLDQFSVDFAVWCTTPVLAHHPDYPIGKHWSYCCPMSRDIGILGVEQPRVPPFCF